MSIYSDKLSHVHIVINCRYSVAQMCTREDTLAHNLGLPYFDDVTSYNSLTTSIAPSRLLIGVWDLSWRQHLWFQDLLASYSESSGLIYSEVQEGLIG